MRRALTSRLGVLLRLLLILTATILQGQVRVWAGDVPPHLVGYAKSLLSQIDENDFAAADDPDLARKVSDLLGKTRLRNWAGAPPQVPANMQALAEGLGLDLTRETQRAALDRLLASRDDVARRGALENLRELTGRPETLETMEARYQDAMLVQLQGLQRRARLQTPAGEVLDIEWEPDSGSLLLRMKVGDDEIVLHGGTAAKLSDGNLSFSVEADAAPVSRITPAMQTSINRSIFGIWRAGDGDVWMIRDGPGGNGGEEGGKDPLANALGAIEEDKRRLEEISKDKVYVWVDEKGGEVIQKKFKRLPPPFRYDRERSELIHSAESEALRKRIAEAEQQLQLPPVKQHDPIGLKRKSSITRKIVAVEVIETTGRRFIYDEAAFDGKRLTAERTLRDTRDIVDLPDWVVSGLISSWSPPEWIELEAKFNPRNKTVALEGLWWRLNVTYDPAYQNISGIHTPYSKMLTLTREDEDVMLRLVDLKGATINVIGHDQPFRLQARFTEQPSGEPVAKIIRNGGDAEVELHPAAGPNEPLLFESGILYARSAQFANRKDPPGLFLPERFTDAGELELRQDELNRLTSSSQGAAASLFEGAWRVTHQRYEEDRGTTGIALVNAGGTSARLVLETGQLYQSVDIRATRGTDPDPSFLEVLFEQVSAFGAEPSRAAPDLLPSGTTLYFPTLARSFSATLQGAEVGAGLELKPAPEETLRVLLKARGRDHLAGGWQQINDTGFYGQSGQQTWVKEIQVHAVVVDDQYRRESPTTAFYPWGPHASAGSSQDRTIFLFGRGLPTTAGDAVALESMSEGVSYLSARFASEMPPAVLEKAWKKADAIRGPDGPVRTPDDVGVFVTARFERQVEPGVKLLTLNGVPAAWPLDFADARGRAYFIDMPPAEGIPTDVYMSSDTGYLELKLEAPIPYKPPLVFKMSRNGKEIGDIPVEPVTDAIGGDDRGLLYRSPPLQFFRSARPGWSPPEEPGALRFDVDPASEGEDMPTQTRFAATWADPLRLTVPKPAEVTIADDEMSEVWRKALERAAACYGGKVKIDPKATSQENSAFILMELWSFRGPFKSSKVTIGDHAAAILIRDEFNAVSRDLAQTYLDTAATDSDLDDFVADGIASKGRSDALWKVMSATVGDETFPAEDMLDVDHLARRRGTSKDEAVVFRREQLRSMLNDYARSIYASIQRAAAAKDCNVDELLLIAGQPVPLIAARILPRLVKRRDEGNATFWEADEVARTYVRTLHIKGEELRALAEYAAADDTYKALALALAGGGVGFAASRLGYLGAAAYATAVADGIDMAYFGTKGVLDYQKGEEFYDFANGASAAFGTDYLEAAAAQRQSALAAAAGVLLPGIGITGVPGTFFSGSLGDLRQIERFERGAEVARNMGRIDTSTIARLSEAERLDLLAYIDQVREASRIAPLREALKEATGLKKTGNAWWDLAKAKATSTGRRLEETDTAFLKRFDDHLADAQAQIQRGRDVATKLDDLQNSAALDVLTEAERADLTKYVTDVRIREAALKSAEFEGKLAVPSAREVEVARLVESAPPARAASAASPTPSPRIADAAPSPVRLKDPAKTEKQPIVVPQDQASLTSLRPVAQRAPGANKELVPAPDTRGTEARAPPVETPLENLSGPVRGDASSGKVQPNGPAEPPRSSDAPAPRRETGSDIPAPSDQLARNEPGKPPVAARDALTRSAPPRPAVEAPVQDGKTPVAARPEQPQSSAARSPRREQFEWGPPLSPGTVLPVRTRSGEVVQVTLDRHLKNGSSNSVYRLQKSATETEDWVARISRGAPENLPNRVDEEGWRALDAVKGDAVVVPARKGPYEVEGSLVGQKEIDRVRLEVVEFSPYRAAEQIPPGGVPTPGQAIALDRAKRAFNAKGYAWLDNHPGNYGFRPRDPANPRLDEWQVVVFDPGGIVRIADDVGNAAAVARQLQLRIENPSPRVDAIMQNAHANGDNGVKKMWAAQERADVLAEYGQYFDLSRLGTNNPADIGFRTDGMVFYPNVRALSRVEGDAGALEDAYKALRSSEAGQASSSLRIIDDGFSAPKPDNMPRDGKTQASTLSQPPPPSPIESPVNQLHGSSSSSGEIVFPQRPLAAVDDEGFDPLAFLEKEIDLPSIKRGPFESSSAWDSNSPLDQNDLKFLLPSADRKPAMLSQEFPPEIRRPIIDAPNLKPQSISPNWRVRDDSSFDVGGRPARGDATLINPLNAPRDLFSATNTKPRSSGKFADVRILRDADGKPIGYVSKTYGERVEWVRDGLVPADPKTGRCAKPCWKAVPVLDETQAVAMAEDTLHGARILEAANIPQLEIVAHDLEGFPPRVVQRALGQNKPKTADGEVVEEIFAEEKLGLEGLSPPFAEAFADLIQKLRDNGIFWEDMHLGNVIFQKVKTHDGKEYWRAGVSDTDRIDLFERPRAGREPQTWMRSFELVPGENALLSRAADQPLFNTEDAILASLEHKGHIEWNPALKCFSSLTLPAPVLRAKFQNLRLCP